MRINPDVTFRMLGDSAVLVDLSTNQIFELNPTATAIWDGLSRNETSETIVDTLMRDFDVDATTAAAQVAELVADLQTRRLLVP